ncbi:outer membrane beta-barrel protein [Hyphomicrobium sp.]|uniref:outer membrane protein n=1 Tax=Hyphomicrobium sp. TaxID=82 RepID=UPI001DD072A5|nr:outer membrane beta-barrel protein [Hyphomicrobium sp.]MBY0560481.1 outer membrane beta-barrel protein [Hyphomicrobium sp.]
MLCGRLLAHGSCALFLLASASAASAGDVDGIIADDGKWSGAYVGLNAGYGWSDLRSTNDFGSAPANFFAFDVIGLAQHQNDRLDGYVVGGQVGFQRQFGRWVLGVEGTLDATGMDDSAKTDWQFDNIGCFGFFCIGAAGAGAQTLDAKIDQLYMVSGKIGYAFDDWLAYVRGGYAGANVTAQSSIGGDVIGCFGGCIMVPVSTSSKDQKRMNGWSVGGGLERMVLPNLTIGVEYNYISLGAETFAFNGDLNIDGVSLPNSYKARIDPDSIQTVTFRMNFLLNSPEHVAAAPLK